MCLLAQSRLRPLLGLGRYPARPGPRPFGAIQPWRADSAAKGAALLGSILGLARYSARPGPAPSGPPSADALDLADRSGRSARGRRCASFKIAPGDFVGRGIICFRTTR